MNKQIDLIAMKKENNITFIRAMAMILVVLGHSFAPFLENGVYWKTLGVVGTLNAADIIRGIVYSFHMPLFMSVSGYLFYYEIENSLQICRNKERIKSIITFTYKKIWRLVVPFILVMYLWRKPLAYLLGTESKPDSLKSAIIFHTTGPLWYLYVLFAIFILEKIIMWFIWSNENHIKISLICMAAFAYLGYFMSGVVHHVLIYNFYFLIGITIHKYFEKIKKVSNAIVILLLAVSILLTSALLWGTNTDIAVIDILLQMVIAIIDIIIIYRLTVHLRHKDISKIILVLDSCGMGIYLFHTELIQLLVMLAVRLNIGIVWLLEFIGGFVLSLLLTYFLKKIGFKLILGEFRPKHI